MALQEKYKDFNVLFIGEDSPTISLTFDEGYENGFTPRILDILKEKEVKATFFITGDYYRRAPELIRRMIDEGHTVGSHSDKHIDFTKASTEDCIADLTLLHENIRKDFDYEMRCFRFPTGAFSQRSLELIKDLGYKSVFWSFGYKDWDPKVQMKPEEALEKLKSSLHPGEVLLLHPVGETNCTILGDFIDSVKEKGYEFTTVL
ncbi:MAG: polysaccharide deacetylase family protein [Oscillospiraceae bacterium]